MILRLVGNPDRLFMARLHAHWGPKALLREAEFFVAERNLPWRRLLRYAEAWLFITLAVACICLAGALEPLTY